MAVRQTIQGAERCRCGACDRRCAATVAVKQGAFVIDACPACAADGAAMLRAFGKLAADLIAAVRGRR